MRVKWLAAALRNLDEHAGYIAEDNPTAAITAMERVRVAVEDLARHPAMGRAGRVPMTRELVIAGTPFLVVYRVRRDVEILRVLHGAQAWPPRR